MSTGEAFWDDLERLPTEERFERAKKIRNKMGIYGPGGQTPQDFYKISRSYRPDGMVLRHDLGRRDARRRSRKSPCWPPWSAGLPQRDRWH
jgi:hypothetical protein